MIRYFLFAASLSLLAACAQRLVQDRVAVDVLQPEPHYPKYDPGALAQLHWLSGAWKGRDAGKEINQTFLFHTNQMLEVFAMQNGVAKPSQFFTWKEGRYYYGQNRQWIVVWIGSNAVRFDPLTPGLDPMTWAKVDGTEWHLIRHTEAGDQVTVMQRVLEPNS